MMRSALLLSSCLLVSCAPAGEPPSGEVSLAVFDCNGGPVYTCYRDADGDGLGAGLGVERCSCHDPGFAPSRGDCDDGNAARYQMLGCHRDADGDELGAAATSQVCAGATCATTSGYIDDASDCDDGSATRWQMLRCRVDADGDHYGVGSTTRVCAGLTCADGIAGYAESAGDCDDGDDGVHPVRSDVPENEIDDDCDGTVDEATPVYSPGGNDNTASSFAILLSLGRTAEIDAADAGDLYAKVHYRKLENASDGYVSTGILPVSSFTIGTSHVAEVTVTGLDALSVYEALVQLHERDAAGDDHPITSCLQFPAGSASAKAAATASTASTAPCSSSDPYYTITMPAGANMPVKTARAQIVLNGLYEYYWFRTRSLGSWDESLLDRYQLKERDTKYCSEFYANAAQPYLVDMNPCEYESWTDTPQCDPGETSEEENYVLDLKDWFDEYGAALVAFQNDFGDVRPGDWLGVDPRPDEPDGGHSQMFLAYDAADEKYWLLEGNGSEETADGTVEHTVNVRARGVCDSGSTYCPSSAAGTCASGCLYLRWIGKVNNSLMLD